MKIDFHEIDESRLISYLYFVTQVSNYDLRELNGFKVRNILSIAFNRKIRDFILEDLFSQKGNFLSIETKDIFDRYLSSDEIDDLRNLLSNYLDYQIESSWYENVCQVLTESSLNTIVVSSSILDSYSILNELKVLFPHKKFTDWRSIKDTTSALFLDYNQSWKKRNIFSMQENDSNFIFLKHFFENVYKRRIYNDEKQIFKSINTTLRKQLFGDEIIAGLKDNLETLKPLVLFNKWDLLHESDDKNYNNPQEEFLIYFDKNRSNKYRVNESFLLENCGKYYYRTGKELIIDPTSFENKFNFSNIENIIKQIDINELNKAFEKDNSLIEIIQPLWRKFNLNEANGRLWKQLLKRKVDDGGLEITFSQIEQISGIKQFVSLKTFQNTYCDPHSPTVIPREKRVFKAICKYLELPLEYRLAIQRERILIGGNSQELNMKLKPLIETIIGLRVLDKHKNDDKLLEILNENLEKIEEKVDMDYFGFTKDSLIYVCIAICYEIIKKMRLKPIKKIVYITPN